MAIGTANVHAPTRRVVAPVRTVRVVGPTREIRNAKVGVVWCGVDGNGTHMCREASTCFRVGRRRLSAWVENRRYGRNMDKCDVDTILVRTR